MFENWSRCIHISRAEKPRVRIPEFKFAVAMDTLTGETGPPWRSCRRSSSSISWTAFSATVFLFRFLARPIPRTILWSWGTESLSRALKHGARSVRIMARVPSKGRMSMHRLIKASRSVSWRSLARTDLLCMKCRMHARKVSTEVPV